MAKAEWTVMVLMGANNLPNEADLTKFADDDIAEMQEVGSHDGILNVVVQIDRKPSDGSPERFKVTQTGPTSVAPVTLDGGSSGDTSVLEDFLRWARDEYPGDHYLLVIWGHAWRFAFLRDGTDALDFTKMSDALQNVYQGEKIDIVAFDSCNVSWIEAAYQFRNVAKYLVATQFIDPLPGWPYKEILERIVNPGSIAGKAGEVAQRKPIDADDLGRAIVSQFVRHYEKPKARLSEVSAGGDQSATVTMTALDLERVSPIGDAIARLSIALALSVNGDTTELDTLMEAFERSQVQTNESAADLTTLCWHLMNHSGSPDVRAAAAGVGDLLLRPNKPFIVAHAKSDLTVAMLNGVSIFAPTLRKPGFDPDSIRPLYEMLDLSQATLWDELVYALADTQL
jgi:hypothetical protein